MIPTGRAPHELVTTPVVFEQAVHGILKDKTALKGSDAAVPEKLGR
jgi:hypothetical protein